MTPIDSFFSTTFWPRKKHRCSENTERLHRVAIRNFGRFLERPATLADFTDETMADFIHARIKRVSPFTANRDAEKLLTVWRWAARKKFVETFPDVEFAREPKRVPMGWLQEEVGILFRTIDLLRGFVGIIPARLYWHGLHAVIWDSSERIGAVREVRWDDLDLRSGWLNVRAEYRKGKREDKAAELHADTLNLLRQFPRREGPIFPWPFCEGTLYNHYKKILASAGLPTDRRSKFHRVRRTVASYFKAAGGNAQELLGHANARTTELYLDPRICGAPQPCTLIFRPGVERICGAAVPEPARPG